jgi:fructose/tagatose bisphosphate aldolase
VTARDRDPDIAVEGELGRIGGREDTTPAQALAERTSPDEAAAFVEATGVDILAPNLGNLHRMPDDSSAIDLDLVRAISLAADRALALHGGSGVEQGLLRAAAEAGIAKVNVSSRVTRALAGGIRATWDARPDELDAPISNNERHASVVIAAAPGRGRVDESGRPASGAGRGTLPRDNPWHARRVRDGARAGRRRRGPGT